MYSTRVKVSKGVTELTPGTNYGLKISSKSSNGGEWKEETVGKGIVSAVDGSNITLDLHLADQTIVGVKVIVAGEEVDSGTLCTIRRVRSAYEIDILNDEQISHDQEYHVDECVVSGGGLVYATAENTQVTVGAVLYVGGKRNTSKVIKWYNVEMSLIGSGYQITNAGITGGYIYPAKTIKIWGSGFIELVGVPAPMGAAEPVATRWMVMSVHGAKGVEYLR